MPHEHLDRFMVDDYYGQEMLQHHEPDMIHKHELTHLELASDREEEFHRHSSTLAVGFPTRPKKQDFKFPPHHNHKSKDPIEQYWKRIGLFGCSLLGCWLVLIFYFVFLICIY